MTPGPLPFEGSNPLVEGLRQTASWHWPIDCFNKLAKNVETKRTLEELPEMERVCLSALYGKEA